MSEKKLKKSKITIATRAPQKRGIFDNLGKDRQSNVKHPMVDFLNFPSEVTTDNNPTDTTDTTSYTNTTDTTNTFVNRQSTSPERDFTKTPNSITRVLLAQGLFRGKSKQIYDFLWSISRGAIKPIRTFRKTHKDIMKGAGIGSRNTVINGLRHLESIGLVKIISAVGVLIGNEYEIFTPDELGYTSYTDTTGITDTTGLYQKVVIPVIPLSGITDTTQTIENKGTYSATKTSFKDNEKNDDEAYAGLIKILDKISERVTGKVSVQGQKEKWRELGEVLLMEFEIAAARTDEISNAPAFLTEHLRRRLLRKTETKPTSRNRTFEKTSVNSSLQVGKQSGEINYEMEEFIAEPLTGAGRETVLETMREYIAKGQTEFVMSLRETYTREDWQWLENALSEIKRDTESGGE